MGLHHKSRDYLFQEFVKRSYRDSKGAVQKALLSIRPDEIASMKEDLDAHNGRILALLSSMRGGPATRKEAETGYLELIRRYAPATRAAIYAFEEKDRIRFRAGVGACRTLPKILKVDRDLIPAIAEAETVASIPSDSPLAHDFRRQRLVGCFAILFRRQKPTALVHWNQEGVATDPYLLLLLEVLAIQRGDRALPSEPVKKPASRPKRVARQTPRKPISPKTPKKRIIPPGILDDSISGKTPLEAIDPSEPLSPEKS
jgi:hypothetical protein